MYMKKSNPTDHQQTSEASLKSTPKKARPLLDDIHNKIIASPALNGGFDTLLYKIDKIEQGQGQLVAKVDKIHDAIYNPSEGMFAKLAEHKLENEKQLGSINLSLSSIDAWKDQKEKESAKDDKDSEQAATKIAVLEKSVDHLVKSKDATWSVLKWLGAALGGGLITLIFAWLEGKIK